MEHKSLGNTIVNSGIVHKCSCGWESRPCFSNAVASCLGMDHREEMNIIDKYDLDVAKEILKVVKT